MYYNEHFKKVNEKLGLPAEAVRLFAETIQMVDADEALSKTFGELFVEFMTPGIDADKTMNALTAIAEEKGINPYTFHFVFLLACTEPLLAKYKEKGISEDIYWDTLMDLRYKFDECVACKEVYGTFVATWNKGFFVMNRFALGRFQYEYAHFGDDEYTTKCGIKMDRGVNKTVGFHIPSSGQPLTDEVRFDSYRKAYEFFKDYKDDSGYVIFECGSWLLFDEHKDFLPAKSNILKFINDFELTWSEEKDEFSDAWRIFDKYGYMEPEKWPEDNSLRKAFKDRVLSGKKTGHGHGVIVFDGENIVR